MRGDLAILSLIEAGRLRVDAEAGLVFSPKSNTPEKPIGALTAKGCTPETEITRIEFVYREEV